MHASGLRAVKFAARIRRGIPKNQEKNTHLFGNLVLE
jgi:hypothetical protein